MSSRTRSLSLLSLLHDDMPVRRALHASRRSRARAYRGDVSAAVDGPGDAQRACGDPALSTSLRAGVAGSALARPFAGLLKRGIGAPRKTPRLVDRLAALLALTPRHLPAAMADAVCRAGAGQKTRPRRAAEGLRATGARSAINAAAIRLLTRNGIEVVEAPDEGCCGALVHHMGSETQALDFARANVDAWTQDRRRWRARRHPGHGLRLRHDAEGLRLHAARAIQLMPRRRRELPRLAKDSDRISRELDIAPAGRRHGHASLIMRPARCSMGRKSRNCRKNCFPSPASWSKMCRKGIYAAARPGPTTFCSRSLPSGCATARLANIERCGRT